MQQGALSHAKPLTIKRPLAWRWSLHVVCGYDVACVLKFLMTLIRAPLYTPPPRYHTHPPSNPPPWFRFVLNFKKQYEDIDWSKFAEEEDEEEEEEEEDDE